MNITDFSSMILHKKPTSATHEMLLLLIKKITAISETHTPVQKNKSHNTCYL